MTITTSMSKTQPNCPQFLRKAIVYALIGAFSMPIQLTSYAANHPLASVSANDIQTVDYVVNVDWDYDSPPGQFNNPAQPLDRTYITNVIRVMAQSVFTMTEGRHRIGNVFVYRNKQFGNNVNIQLINKDGRASGSWAGWGSRDASTFNYTSFSKNAESINDLGKTVAHELGHYTYGLLDEYVEAGSPLKASDPGAPSQDDNAKNTIMNNHLNFLSLSTPTDYADAGQRQTAQARVMGTPGTLASGSAWETLTRLPSNDPEAARGANRTFFEAFRGINPATLKLTQPVTGFDAKLNMIFVPAPTFRDVIVVDRTLSPDRFAELMQAAKAMVAKAGADTQFAILASPALGTEPVLNYTPATAEGKKTLENALSALATTTTGTFDSLSAFTEGYKLVSAARQPGDMVTFHLLTGTETSLPAEAASSARLAKIIVNPLGLTGGDPAQQQALRSRAVAGSASGSAISLTQLAHQTGGSYNASKTGAEAAKEVIRASKEAHSETYGILKVDQADKLAANGQFSSKFSIASGSTDGEVTAEVTFGPADSAKLQWRLMAPNGTAYTPTTLPDGITFENYTEEGVVSFSISADLASRVGEWTVQATANAATLEGIGVEVSSNARTTLSAELIGGTAGAATRPILQAVLGGEQRIKGAVVTANVYATDGSLALANVVLRDDGVSPDTRAGDGQYAADLSGKLAAGEYTVVLSAQTNSDSRTASLGSLVKGTRAEELPVETLTRMTEASFTLEAGATGVSAESDTSTSTASGSSSSSSGGGGCTVNPDGRDAGLLVLLLSALAGLGLRRRATVRTNAKR